MLADLCDASVVRLDSGDGWAPKSCLPKRLALSLAWKDRPSETLEFVYLRSGAYRDAFVSPADRLLLFKAHLPPRVPYHKVKGSLANDEEYALALNNENHGLPIPHLHGLVGVRVQQDWLGPVDYQLLFQQRIDFTFADWIQAHEGTPPSSDHLTRVVDMILIAVRIMGRLVSPPYNYELADWHCDNFGYCEAGHGALTFYLVDFQCNGIGPGAADSNGRRRMKAAYMAMVSSLMKPAFLANSHTSNSWKAWLRSCADVLKGVWDDTWHSGSGEVYDDAVLRRLRGLMEQSLPTRETPEDQRRSSESSTAQVACGPWPRTCSDASLQRGAPVSTVSEPAVLAATAAAACGPWQRTCSDATLQRGAPVSTEAAWAEQSSLAAGREPSAGEKRPREEPTDCSSSTGTMTCASDVPAWPSTAGSVCPPRLPRHAAFPSAPRLSPAACEHLAWIQTAPWKHGRNHGASSMPLATRRARDEWHLNPQGGHVLAMIVAACVH